MKWKIQKRHECRNTGKVKRLELYYDGNCTSRYFRSGTYETSGRLIFVEQIVPGAYIQYTSHENSTDYQDKLKIKMACENSQQISGYQPLLC
jgi:hypothetical protein